uniref:DUF8040 domain-containing protein n=1 Tax=Cucumis melo TaxID=3656 RepID=A0A9I9DLI9_CUCME
MDRRCFAILCHLLRTTARLVGTEVIDVEEMVAMFLHILAHDMKNRIIQREFVRSGETVSRHFNLVLLSVLRLHNELLKKPQLVTNSCMDPRWKWFESHPAAKDLLHKSFPYYDDLFYVFGKDRATRARSETFADVGSNVPNMFNGDVPLDDSHDQDIPMMYSQGVHMSPDEMFGIRAGQASERKNCSSGSKRKQGSKHYETVEVIKSAIEFGNDQLKAIANWPKEKRATEVELRAEVMKQLQDIPELQSRDRAKLIQILFRSVEAIEGFLSIPTERKLEYCNILLQN